MSFVFFSSSCFYLLSRMLVLNVLLSSVVVRIWDVWRLVLPNACEMNGRQVSCTHSDNSPQ